MLTLPGRPLHCAPPLSLGSFKSHWSAAVAAASLLVSALPASAISIKIVEDTSTRLAFDVVWGLSVGATADDVLGSFSFVEGRDTGTVVRFSVYSDWTDDPDLFGILFAAGSSVDRIWEGSDVSTAFEGSQKLALDGNPYGARFVYGTPFPSTPPTGVPDHGATALLLAASLSGLTLLRRTVG